MRNKKLLLLFVLTFISVTLKECAAKGGRGSSSSHGSHSSHSSGRGFGSSSKSSHSHSSSGGHFSSSRSSSHTYPSSSSGLSGSSSSGSHSYPSSPTGLSGSYGSPSWSGSGSRITYGHGSTHGSGSQYAGGSPYVQYVPTYYTAPQHVYITQYRNSDSQYSDLLHGLTLYNLGRSHSHYQEHYYYDDYYHRRYVQSNSGSGHSSNYGSEDKIEASCTLRIKENEKIQVLKIPCEIVTTFAEGDGAGTVTTTQNDIVCVTNTTTAYDTLTVNGNGMTNAKAPTNVGTGNSTNCTIVTDPLSAKGPKLNADKMECSVEVKTEASYVENKVDCKTLLEYAKMKEPAQESKIMPSRGQLKSWLASPPWWMSSFIVV